jgi:hypothetical protein
MRRSIALFTSLALSFGFGLFAAAQPASAKTNGKYDIYLSMSSVGNGCRPRKVVSAGLWHWFD